MTAARYLTLLLTAPLVAAAAEPVAAPTPPKTLLNAPGKLLLSDDLSGPPGKDWKAGKGKWESVGGAIRGSEQASDEHAATFRRNLTMKDVVVEYSFKLDGAKKTTLSFNAEKGHLCRVLIGPANFTLSKDKDKAVDGDKAVQLAAKDVPIKPGEWHTLVVETRGPDMLVTLDGAHTAYGSHPAVAKGKANIGFTVAGQSVSFKGLRIWEAGGPAPDWESTKAKLLAGQKK
jgi:hypothetical protein